MQITKLLVEAISDLKFREPIRQKIETTIELTFRLIAMLLVAKGAILLSLPHAKNIDFNKLLNESAGISVFLFYMIILWIFTQKTYVLVDKKKHSFLWAIVNLLIMFICAFAYGILTKIAIIQ